MILFLPLQILYILVNRDILLTYTLKCMKTTQHNSREEFKTNSTYQLSHMHSSSETKILLIYQSLEIIPKFISQLFL